MPNNRFTVMVKPNAAENKILEYNKETNTYRVAIKAPPEDDKANKEVIRFFSKLLKKRVTIAHGLKSREKVLEIIG